MAELDISANSIQLDCSVDSGICVEGATKDLKKKLQEFKRILFILERDKEAMRVLRERLSRIAERKIAKKKKDGQDVCNVCFTPIDTDDSKTCIACCSCAKNVCRDEKCSEWVPKEGEWRCQLCATRRDSYGKASTWVEEQYSVKGATPLFSSFPMRARSEIYIPLCDPNESAFLCNFESVSEAPSPINTNQKQHIREYIEEVLADMIGGSLDTATVAPLSTDENYQQVRNGHELQGVSNVRLRRLIESVIAETIRQPPFSSSGLTTTTAIDSSDIDHHHALALNGNHCNGNGGQYFESKKYQDLLATAVLNKIVSTHGNGRHSESSPDLTSSSVLDNNHNALNLSKTDESVSSSSSVEPRSESSLTDPIRSINKDDELSPIGNYRNFYEDAANDNIDADRESVLSDFIASHMVPLPHISNDPESEEEDDEEDFISVASSRDAAWEDNWLFKKKKSSKTSSSVGMLVPAPKEDIRALIGDKPTDEVSDLSEAGSDTDDSLEMVSASLEPLNDRLVNQHLIGGKNTKIVLDELVEQTSMISTSSLPENVPPYTETKNEFVVSNDGLNESEPLKIPVNSCNKTIGNEAINSDVTKCVSTKAEKLGKETHQVIEDESIVPPPNDFTDDEKMRNLLAKFNEEQNNKTDSGDDNSSSLSPRSSISCALSAGIDRAELDAYEGITDFCVEDEESLASEIDMSMAESTSRRPSVIEILAAIALGPMLAVSASDDRNILSELEVKSLMELNELAMAELNAKNAEERRLGVIVEESFDSSSVDENKIESVGIGEETDLLSSPKMVMDAIRELVGKEPKVLDDASEDYEERTIEDNESTIKVEEVPEELGGADKEIKESIESKIYEPSYEDPEQGKENSSSIEKGVEKDKSIEALEEDAIKSSKRKLEKQLEFEDTVEVVLDKEADKRDEILDESKAIHTSKDTFVDLHIESFTTLNEDLVMSEEAKDVILPEQIEMKKNTEAQALEAAIDEKVLESETKQNASADLDPNIETNSMLEDLTTENIIPDVTSSISSESLHTIGSSPEISDDMDFDTSTKRENISSLAELSDRKLQEIKEESKPKSEDTGTNNEFILPPPVAFCDEALKSLNEINKNDTVQVTEAHIISETVQAISVMTSEKINDGIESKANEQNIKTHNENLLTDSVKRTEDIQREKLSLEELITKACEVTSLKKIVCQGESEEPPDKQLTEELPTKLITDSNCNQSEKPKTVKIKQSGELDEEKQTITTTEEHSSAIAVEQNSDATTQSVAKEILSEVQLTLEETQTSVQTADPETTEQNNVSDKNIEESNPETLSSKESVEDEKILLVEVVPTVKSSALQSMDLISGSQAIETQSTEQQTENEKEDKPESKPTSETTEELNIENSQRMPLVEEVKTEQVDEQQISEEPIIAQQCEQLTYETKSFENDGALQVKERIERNEQVEENENINSAALQTTKENENIFHSIEETTKNNTESPSNTAPMDKQKFEKLELEEPQADVSCKIEVSTEEPLDLQQINKQNEDASIEVPCRELHEIIASETVEIETLPLGESIAESISGECLKPSDDQNKEEFENQILVDKTIKSEELQPIEQCPNNLQTKDVPFDNISQDIADNIEVSLSEKTVDVKINEDITDETFNTEKSIEEIALSSEVSPETQLTEEVKSEAMDETQTIEENNEMQNKRQEENEESTCIPEVNTTSESDVKASEEQTKSISPKTDDFTSDLIPSKKLQQDELKTVVEEKIKTLEIEAVSREQLLESTKEVPEEQIPKLSGCNEPPTADIASVEPFFKKDIMEEANEDEEKQIAVSEPTVLETETANEVSNNEIEKIAVSETINIDGVVPAETPEIPTESTNIDETAAEKISEAKNDTNITAELSSLIIELQTEESSEDLKPHEIISDKFNNISCTEESLKIAEVAEENQLKSQTECLSSEQGSNENQMEEVILPEERDSLNETKAAAGNQTDDDKLVQYQPQSGSETEPNIISNAESSTLKKTQEDVLVETLEYVQNTEQSIKTKGEENVRLLEPPKSNKSEIDNVSDIAVIVENKRIDPDQCAGNISVEKISDELQKVSTPETVELISGLGTAQKAVVFDEATIISLAENTSNVTVTDIVSNACMIGDNSVQSSIEIPKEEIETVQQQAGNVDQFSETIKLENTSEGHTENLLNEGIDILPDTALTQTEKPLDGLEFKSKTGNEEVDNEEDASNKELLQLACDPSANENIDTEKALELLDSSKTESVNTEQVYIAKENIHLTILPNNVRKESNAQKDTNLDTSILEEAQANSQSQTKTVPSEEETKEIAKPSLGEQNLLEQDTLKSTISTVINSNNHLKDVDPKTVCKEEVEVTVTTSADTDANQNIIDDGSEKIKSDVETTVDDTQVEEKATEKPAAVDVPIISTSTTNVSSDEPVIACKDETISPAEICVNQALTEEHAIEATSVVQPPDSEKADRGSELPTEQPSEILLVRETTIRESLLNEMNIEEILPEIEAKEQGSEPDISSQPIDFVEQVEVVQVETVEVEIILSKQNTEADTVKQERIEEVSESRDTEQIEGTTTNNEAISIDSEHENNSSETPTVENLVSDACTSMKTDEPVLVEEAFETQTTKIPQLIEAVEKHSAESSPIDEIQVLNVNPDNSVESSPTAETLSEQILKSSIKTDTEDSSPSESINTDIENSEDTTNKVQNEDVKSKFEDVKAELIPEDSISNNQNRLPQDTQMTPEIELNMDKTLNEAIENETLGEDRKDSPKEDEAIAALSTSVENEEQIVSKSQKPIAEESIKISTDEVNIVEVSLAPIPEKQPQNVGETAKESQALVTDTNDSSLKAEDEITEQVPEDKAKEIDEFSEAKTIKSTNPNEEDTLPEKVQNENIGMDLKFQTEVIPTDETNEELKSSDQIILQKSDDEEKEEKETALVETTMPSEPPNVNEEITAITTKQNAEETPKEELLSIEKESTEESKSQETIPEEAVKTSVDGVCLVEDSHAEEVLDEIKPIADSEIIKDTSILEKEAQNEAEPMMETQAPIIDNADPAFETQNEHIEQPLKNEENRVQQGTEQDSEPIQTSAENTEPSKSISSDIYAVDVTKEREKEIKIETIDVDVESQTKIISVEKIPEELRSNDQAIMSSTIAEGTQKSDDKESKQDKCSEILEKATSLLETMTCSESPLVNEETTEMASSSENAGNLPADAILEDLNSIPENESLKDSEVPAKEVQIEEKSLTQPLEPLTAAVESLSQSNDEQTEKVSEDETKEVEDTTKILTENSQAIESANTEIKNAQCTKDGEEDNVPEKIQNQIDEEQAPIEVIPAKEIAEELKSNDQDVIPVTISDDTEKSDIKEKICTEAPEKTISLVKTIDNEPLVEEPSEMSKPQEPISEKALIISAETVCAVEEVSAETTLEAPNTDNESIKGKDAEKDKDPVKESQVPVIDTTNSSQIDQAPEKEVFLEEPIEAAAEILEPIKSIDTEKETVEETKEQEMDNISGKIANVNIEGVSKSQGEVVSVENHPEELKANDEVIMPITITQGTHESDEIEKRDKNCTEISLVTAKSSEPSTKDEESSVATNDENLAEIPRELVSIDNTTVVEQISEVSESQEPVMEEAMKSPTDHVSGGEDLPAESVLDSKVDNETKVLDREEYIPEKEVELLTGEVGVVEDLVEGLIVEDASILEREVQIKAETAIESQAPLTGINNEQIEKVPEDEAKEIDKKSEQTSESSNKTSTEIPEMTKSTNTEVENIQCYKEQDEPTVPEIIQRKSTDEDLKSQTENNVEESKLDDQAISPSIVSQEDGDTNTLTSNIKNAEEVPEEDTSIEKTTTELSQSQEPIPEAAIQISTDEVCEFEVLASEEISGDLNIETSIPNKPILEEVQTTISAEESLEQTSDTCVSTSKTNDEPEVEATLIEQPENQGLENLNSESELVLTVYNTEDQQLEKIIEENTMLVLDSDPAGDNFINDRTTELRNTSGTSTSQDSSKDQISESEKEDPAVDTKTTFEIPETLGSYKPPEEKVKMTPISEDDSVETKSSSGIISEDVTTSSEENSSETTVAIETKPDESVSQNTSNKLDKEVITVLEQATQSSNSYSKSEIEAIPIVVPPDLYTTAAAEENSSEAVKVLHTEEIANVAQQNDMLLHTNVVMEAEKSTIEIEDLSKIVDVLQNEEISEIAQSTVALKEEPIMAALENFSEAAKVLQTQQKEEVPISETKSTETIMSAKINEQTVDIKPCEEASVNIEIAIEEPKPKEALKFEENVQSEEVIASSECVEDICESIKSNEPVSGQQEIYDHLPATVVLQEEAHNEKVSAKPKEENPKTQSNAIELEEISISSKIQQKEDITEVSAALTIELTEELKPQAEPCSEDSPKQEESVPSSDVPEEPIIAETTESSEDKPIAAEANSENELNILQGTSDEKNADKLDSQEVSTSKMDEAKLEESVTLEEKTDLPISEETVAGSEETLTPIIQTEQAPAVETKQLELQNSPTGTLLEDIGTDRTSVVKTLMFEEITISREKEEAEAAKEVQAEEISPIKEAVAQLEDLEVKAEVQFKASEDENSNNNQTQKAVDTEVAPSEKIDEPSLDSKDIDIIKESEQVEENLPSKDTSETTEVLEKQESTSKVMESVEFRESSKSEALKDTVMPVVDENQSDHIKAQETKTVSQDAFIHVNDLKTGKVTEDVILKPAEVVEETADTKAMEMEEIIEASKPLDCNLVSKDSQIQVEIIQNKENISINESLTKPIADESQPQVSAESSKETIEIDLRENIQMGEQNDIKAERSEKELEAQEIIDLAIDSSQAVGTSTSLKSALKITEEAQTENSSDIEPTQIIEELITRKSISSLECPPVSSEEGQITNKLLGKEGKEDILIEEVLSDKIAEEPTSSAQEAQELAKKISKDVDSNKETLPRDNTTEVSKSQHQVSDLEETAQSFVNEESEAKVSEETTDVKEVYIQERAESNVPDLVQKEKCSTCEIADDGKIALVSSEEAISASIHAPIQIEELPAEEVSSIPVDPDVITTEIHTCQEMLSNDLTSTPISKDVPDLTASNKNEVQLSFSSEETSVSDSTASQETSEAETIQEAAAKISINENIPEETLAVTGKSDAGVLIPKPPNASALPGAEETGLILAVASCENLTEAFTEMIAEVKEIPSSEDLSVTCNIITHPPLQSTESLSGSAQYPTEDYDQISHPILETYFDKSAPSLAEELRLAAIRNDTKEPKSERVVPQMTTCENHCFTADPQPTKSTASDSVANTNANAQDASQGNHISQATRQLLFAEQSSKKSKIKYSGSNKFQNLTLRDRRFLAELEKRRKQRELIQNYLDTLDCIDTPSYLNEDLYLFESKCSIESSPYSLFIEPSESDYCIVGASSTSPTAKSHFLNNILFSDRISSESNCTDDSTTTVIDTFGSMGSGSNSDSGEDFSPDDSTDRESSATATATATTANNSTINTNNVTNQSHIYSPPPPLPLQPQPELRTASACSKLFVSRTTGGNEEHVDDDPLKHLVPGSIAEREYKKWYNAVDMPNNPYSVEALRRRLSGGPDRVLDLPNISPCIEENPQQLGECPSAEADDKSQERDYARYSRDYYINDAKHASGTTKKSPTSPPQISSPTPTASSIELEEQAESTAEPVEITPVKEMCHKLEKQCRIEAELYLATPVQVIEDIPQAFPGKIATQTIENLTTEAVSKVSSETSSSLTNESLTPSEDSDTIRIYDLKKQETRLVKEPTHTTTITVPKSPEKKVRPTELNITPTLAPPIATVSTKSSTPTSFKFLQPKRKLIDPSQVLSIDLDTTPITPSTSEKPVIEADVVHAMPSVKALAKAFLMTSTTCTSSDNKWRKARAKSPLQLFKPITPTPTPTPTPAANTSRIVQNQPEPVIADTTSQGSEDATIASDLSSLETDPPSRMDSDAMDTIALARQSSQERALSPVLVSGCLRNNIAFFENLKNK